MADEPAKKKKSGSENRKKQEQINFRVSQAEFEEIEDTATKAGLTNSEYIRQCALKAPKIRARKRITVDVLAVTKLQGDMNKIGGNLHQILKRINYGDTPLVAELQEALTGYKETIATIMAALGRDK